MEAVWSGGQCLRKLLASEVRLAKVSNQVSAKNCKNITGDAKFFLFGVLKGLPVQITRHIVASKCGLFFFPQISRHLLPETVSCVRL
jgi:hypothetical protein